MLNETTRKVVGFMRSIFRIMPVALVATVALGAVTASSAFAAPEWYAKTGGVYNKLTSALSVTGTGKLVFTDNAQEGFLFKEPVKVTCNNVSTLATIEAGGVGQVETLTLKSCSASSNCPAFEAYEIKHLPWKAELYSEGATIRDRLLSGGHGTPEWRFRCSTFGWDECRLTTSAHMTNNATGGVEAAFDEKSNKVHCSLGSSRTGKENTGEVSGVITFPHPASVEAIKVE